MNRTFFICGTLMVCTAVLMAGKKERTQKPDNVTAEVTDVDPATAAWMAYASPGAPHKDLARHAGSWSADCRFWQAPDSEATTATAEAVCEMVMGGRYLIERFNSDYQGMPFEGMGVYAFDNIKQEYVSVWLDNFSTGLFLSQGKKNQSGSIEHRGLAPDPVTKTFRESRSKQTWIDENTRKVEMWHTAPDGTEFKSMEIVYTRM